MRKLISFLIIGLILISGCAKRGDQPTGTGDGGQQTGTQGEITGNETAGQQQQTGTGEQQTEPEPSGEGVDVEISQEDLDELKSTLEDMEYEDLGGLSEG